MGSWANSLHVKHQDAEIVKNAIRLLLLGQSYREQSVATPRLLSVAHVAEQDLPMEPAAPMYAADLSDWEEDDDDDLEDEDASVFVPTELAPEQRGICVFRARHGWVGVLDSGNIFELAELLSAQLRTDALTVMVDDSDAWTYQLHRSGLPFDSFNSSGATDEDDALSPEMMAAMANEDEAAILREMLKRAPQGPIHMPDGSALLPPELALLGERIKSGNASFWQRCRYWWLLGKFLFRLVTGRWQAHPIDMGFDIPRTTPLDAAALARLVERVQAVFPHTGQKALRELLPLNRFPSEELLRNFLAIVDLPSFYAYLNYDYLEEHTLEELSDEGIVWAGEMRFTYGHDL